MRKGELVRDAAGVLWLIAGEVPGWFTFQRKDRLVLVRKRTEFQRRLDVKIYDPSEGTTLTPVPDTEEARKEVMGRGL